MKRVGIALGGGSARGLAHIGVIKKLNEIGINIEVVAGTSIGALIGGWYASLGRVDEIEKVAREMRWRKFLGPKDFSPRAVGAFLNTSRFADWLRIETGDPFIEELPIRFAAVSTDIKTGERVVIKSGKLVDAILASISVPIIFPPVERDGRLLVDGGLVEPVPFKTAKELGAELVIGVNLSADVIFEIGKHIKEQRRWKPWQVFLVLDDALSVIEHQLAMEQKDKDDIMLTPRIGHISTIDFHKVDEGIQAGIEEVSAWRHEILKRAEIPHKIGLFERFFGSQTD